MGVASREGLDVDSGEAVTQHEPKEPRRAPTREEFIATLNRFRDLESDGVVILNNAIVEVDLIKAFDALADERDEWKRRAELEAVSAYDLLARAAKAEAERDAARALVRDLRDSSPCDHFDHHGHCQTHGWMETDPPCPHGRATKLLEALGEK